MHTARIVVEREKREKEQRELHIDIKISFSNAHTLPTLLYTLVQTAAHKSTITTEHRRHKMHSNLKKKKRDRMTKNVTYLFVVSGPQDAQFTETSVERSRL